MRQKSDFFLLFPLLLLIGCNGDEPSTSEPATSFRFATTENISIEEAAPVAQQWLTAYRKRDAKMLRELFDADGYGWRATKCFGLSHSQRSKLITENRLSFINGLLKNLLPVKEEKDYYDLLRVFQQEGKTYGLFRRVNALGMVNHHTLLFVRDPDGKIGVGDLLLSNTGYPVSVGFGLTYLATNRKYLAQFKPFVPTRSRGDMEELEAIIQARKANNAKEIVRICEALPPVMLDDVVFLDYYTTALVQCDKIEKLEDIYRKLRSEKKDLAAIELKMIDPCILIGAFAKAQWVLDHLYKRFDDPYFIALKGFNAKINKKEELALEFFQQAVDEGCDLPMVVQQLAYFAMAKKDWPRTVDALRRAEKYGEPLTLIQSRPGVKEFLATPEGAPWRPQN